MRELDRLGALWQSGTHSPRTLAAAADGIAALNLIAVDRAEAGDALRARGLALLALAIASDGGEHRWASTAMAVSTGYRGEALRLAAGLAQDEPLRLYLDRDEKGLAARVGGRDPAALPALLAARLASELSDISLSPVIPVRPGIVDTSADPAIDAFALAVQPLANGEDFDQTSLKQIAQSGITVLGGPWPATESPRPTGNLRADAARIVTWAASCNGNNWCRSSGHIAEDFETRLSRDAAIAAGPFWDGAPKAAFYRALFYSSLHLEFIEAAVTRSDGEAAATIAASYAEVHTGAAPEYAAWCRDIAALRRERVPVASLGASLGRLRWFGEPLAWQSFRDMSRNQNEGDAGVYEAARLLAARLDTRPSHLQRWQAAAWQNLRDPVLHDKVLRAAATGAGPDAFYLRFRLARWDYDLPAFRALLQDPAVPEWQKAAHLPMLSQFPTGPAEGPRVPIIDAAIPVPDSPEMAGMSGTLLAHSGNPAAAVRVLEGWLAAHPGAEDLRAVRVRRILAETFLASGNAPSAWHAIEPALPSYQGDAMRVGVLTLQKLGRDAEWRGLAGRMMIRYPDGISNLAAVLQCHWSTGDYQTPAVMVRDFKAPLTVSDWMYRIGRAFSAAFNNRPDSEMTAAFDALSVAHPRPQLLRMIPAMLAKDGAPGRAALLMERLPMNKLAPGYQEQLLIEAYRYRRTVNPTDADAWLKSALPPGADDLQLQVYELGDDALVWSLPIPTQHKSAEIAWRIRTFSVLRAGGKADPRWGEVVSHYAAVATDAETAEGRFLTGAISEASLLASVHTPLDRCKAAYAEGLKAQSERRIANAVAWYRVAAEIGRSHCLAANWSYQQLSDWTLQGGSRVLRDESLPHPSTGP